MNLTDLAKKYTQTLGDTNELVLAELQKALETIKKLKSQLAIQNTKVKELCENVFDMNGKGKFLT